MKKRRNERGKGRKNVKRKGRGENEGYLPLRRITCVVSSCYLTELLLLYAFIVKVLYLLSH